MDYKFQRKLEINEWVITTRWFYMVAVFLIGILGNTLMSLFAVKFSFFSIAFLLLVFLAINALLFNVLSEIKKSQSKVKLRLLSVGNIVIELIVFTIIMRLVGDESIASVFFFLPIISAASIFGMRGSVITAIVSVLLVNGSAALDYVEVIIGYLGEKDFINPLQLLELRYKSLDLIKLIVFSNFYLVIGVVSGYSSKLLFRRERELMAQAEQLSLEKKLEEKQMRKLDENAALLAKRDRELKLINIELSKKVNELQKSEKSIIRAFSDLQAARRRADKEKDKTSAIISNFIDPIIVIDNDNKINLVNPAARDIFGFDDSDLGQVVSVKDNYTMTNFKNIIHEDIKVKTNKEIPSYNSDEEEVIVKFGEQELTYKVITAKVVDNNQLALGTMKIFYNLTREKIIDKLKSDFISIAAHQLRTPLSAIKWVIKMVLDGDVGKLNNEQQKLLFKGYQSNERIIELVNDMLNVSRIEEGRYGYVFKKIDMVEILEREVNDIENLVKEKNIKFELHKPTKKSVVYADPKKMGLVIQNLLENAVKYTPEYGSIEVTLEAGDQFIRIKVKDNGVGIPEKDKTKLFSKFFRADNVVRMQTEGSGLGLFIVKNIIESHGGKITFESEEGRGTEFTFTLPIRK